MNTYRADLHIHSVLSPCGDLEMSPVRIVEEASDKKLDIIGITDHNSTLHAKLIERLAKEKGILVLKGAEVTSKEEIHCLTFFETDIELDAFQKFLEDKLIQIPNNPKYFGHQVVVDEFDQILREIEPLLISALNVSVNDLEKKVHDLNGLFIPAHVNKSKFSLTSQLGFIPSDINADALEISSHISKKAFLEQNKSTNGFPIIQSSDAHFPEDIGKACTTFIMLDNSFAEIRKALKGTGGRKVVVS